ncbi:MAG: alpha/beta hydrolase [Sorangiineae bacterium]|nr:alpha/beta hydrolase [Polyangiaceae bacterium]MEB2321543.1 alpha/beta hydrolase [Sorangiineae bacterium]
MSCGAVALHVESFGDGDTIVLAHGFGGSARNFRPQARSLGGEHRFVLFDARGHARSEAPAPAEAYEPDCFVEDLARVVDGTGPLPVVVGGLSMGAGVALRYALAHAERLRGLVLAAFPYVSVGKDGRDWALGFADAIDREGLDRAGAEYAWGERARFDPQGARLIRQGFLEHSPGALAHTLRRLLAVQPSIESLRAELARLTVPTLVIVGALDERSLVPSRELAGALPEVELVVVPGAGHVVNLAAPRAFDAALAAFLDRVRSSQPR